MIPPTPTMIPPNPELLAMAAQAAPDNISLWGIAPNVIGLWNGFGPGATMSLQIILFVSLIVSLIYTVMILWKRVGADESNDD